MEIKSLAETERNRRADLTFLQVLVAVYDDPEFRLEIRPLHPAWREAELYPNGDAPPRWNARTPYGIRQWFTFTPAGIRAGAAHARLLAECYEVYMGVLPRVGRTGKQENVDQSLWLWSDIDGGFDGVEGAYRLLRASGLPTPHMIVISGNGLHCYWCLSEVVEFADIDDRFRFKMLLKRLCNAIGGREPNAHADSSRADVASILRVPETFNNKRGEQPKPVTLDAFTPDAPAYSLTWWQAHLPALPAPRPQPTYAADPMAVSAGLLDWARRPVPEGDRHKTLCAAAVWLIRDMGIGRPVVLDLLQMKTSASPGGRTITRAELEAILSWVK